MTHVVIDGDIIVYSAGFAANEEPEHICLSTVDKMVKNIVNACEANSYTLYLTGKNNFREEVATIQGYKENRKGAEKPIHYQAIREHLLAQPTTVLTEGEEADDALGIAQVEAGCGDDHVIASIDKDLDMIEGWHYNWRKDEIYKIEETEALHKFYLQLLTGDSTDNIAGLYKMTGTKASKKIKEGLYGCLDEVSMYDYVYTVYSDAYNANGMCVDEGGDVVTKWLTEIGQLLWIRRKADEVWTPPTREER